MSPTFCLALCEEAREGQSMGTEVEACLDCLADNFERSCTNRNLWWDCDPVCSNVDGFVRDVRQGRNWDLECWTGQEVPLDVCELGEADVSLQMWSGETSLGDDLVGTGTVTGLDPWTIRVSDGSTLTVRLGGVTPPVDSGDFVRFVAKLQPGNLYANSLTLRDADGGLLLHAWDRAIRPEDLQLAEIEVSLAIARCRSTYNCGHEILRDLVVHRPDGTERRISAGEQAIEGGFLIVSGDSGIRFPVPCTDTADRWSSGAVVRMD